MRQRSTLISIAILLLISVLFSLPVIAQDEETTTIGGYGEMHYNEPDGSAHGTLDFHRFVLFFGHTFTPTLSLKSEVEIEHTKIEGGTGGEVAIEQAYLDWHLSEGLGVRAGILLPPIGMLTRSESKGFFS